MIELAVLGTLLYLLADTLHAGWHYNKITCGTIYGNLTRENIENFHKTGPISTLTKYVMTKNLNVEVLPHKK